MYLQVIQYKVFPQQSCLLLSNVIPSFDENDKTGVETIAFRPSNDLSPTATKERWHQEDGMSNTHRLYIASEKAIEPLGKEKCIFFS